MQGVKDYSPRKNYKMIRKCKLTYQNNRVKYKYEKAYKEGKVYVKRKKNYKENTSNAYDCGNTIAIFVRSICSTFKTF